MCSTMIVLYDDNCQCSALYYWRSWLNSGAEIKTKGKKKTKQKKGKTDEEERLLRREKRIRRTNRRKLKSQLRRENRLAVVPLSPNSIIDGPALHSALFISPLPLYSIHPSSHLQHIHPSTCTAHPCTQNLNPCIHPVYTFTMNPAHHQVHFTTSIFNQILS